MNSDYSTHDKTESTRSWIVAAELYVTTKCDVGCPFCFGQGDFGPKGYHVPIDLLLRRAEILLEYHRKDPFYRVPLLGGEPLLHPDLTILVEKYGKDLPFSLISAGDPNRASDIDLLIEHIPIWGITYNPHLNERYIRLTNRLLEAGRQVVTTMHFWNYRSFEDVNKHFILDALPYLSSITGSWKEDYVNYLKSWKPSTYYQVSFSPFYHNDGADGSMIMRYTMYDGRFTRSTPKDFKPPLIPRGRKFRCHLFVPRKAISIDEYGQVIPCASIAHRHSYPIIKNLENFGHLPENIPEYLDACGDMILAANGSGICDVMCKNMRWSLDE